MFSNELAKRLLGLPKNIEGGAATINLQEEKSRFILTNPDEPEFEFLFEITSNKKIAFKISLHHQENNLREGLMRVDYRGGHKNPETITELVPELIKPFVGYFFVSEPHIHVYVEGFKDLAWAIPLTAYHFPVLEINDGANFAAAIHAFSQEINIITPISIQNSLLL
ncbi:DUF6978 family protein [Dyadobacter sp. CY323]|uniref:DUF6978 family protein n=1 Tax=Dyadobacter sp. CY323 TaxID=2907302 RepID=UPI001F406649|nr:hypothetical protein [Dyadobacter sp. CY323]MCE6988488.1 hypothetical protein [Dyadobacter sp. CY323]